jgi:hypothetical protein
VGEDIEMAVKLSSILSDLLGVTILEIQTVAPTAADDWSETDVAPAEDLGLIPDCEWELKFSSAVDSICDGGAAPQFSFLSFSFD